jgi:hypothetical protein
MSQMGHSRRFGGLSPLSGCPLTADVDPDSAIGGLGPMLSKKLFGG